MFFILSSCSFNYFLINFYVDRIKGTIVSNTLSSQFAEMIAVMSSSPTYSYYGPKRAFTIMLVVSGIGALLLYVYFLNDSLVPVFIFVSKFGISSAFNMTFIAQN